MKVKEIINKWNRIQEGQTVTISEYMGISNPHKKIESKPVCHWRKDWEFDVDDNELARLMNSTANSFSFTEKGLIVWCEDKKACHY